jgi:hypothetical protein
MFTNDDLKRMKNNKDFEGLKQAIFDENKDTRREAVLMLSTMLNEPKAIEMLLLCMASEKDPYIMMLANNAMELSRNPSAVEFLASGMDVEERLSPYVQKSFSKAQVHTRQAEVVDVPDEFVQHKDPMKWLWYLFGFWGITSIALALLSIISIILVGNFSDSGQIIGILVIGIPGIVLLWISFSKLKNGRK